MSLSRAGGSVAVQHFDHIEQHAPATTFPSAQQLDSFSNMFALFGRELLRLGSDVLEADGAVFKMREDLLAQESAGEFAQLGNGFVMRAAIRSDIDRAHGAEVLKVFQALAGRAFAQIEALDDGVHGERFLREEKQAVDFGDGTGLAGRAGKLDEKLDDIHLDRFEFRDGRT